MAYVVVSERLWRPPHVLDELPHRQQIRLLGSLAKVPQPHVLAHPPTPALQGHHDCLQATGSGTTPPPCSQACMQIAAARDSHLSVSEFALW